MPGGFLSQRAATALRPVDRAKQSVPTTSHVLVRFVHLSGELEPVPVFKNAMEYTLLESFAVTRAPTEWSDSEPFILFYLDKDGRELYYEECGTIDYAVERARSVAGVDEGEWRECQFELPADFDRIDLPDIR